MWPVTPAAFLKTAGLNMHNSGQFTAKGPLLTAFRALALLAVLLLSACLPENATFLDPQGTVAAAQRLHLIKVTAITLIAVLPVLVLVPWMLWRYRYGNTKARYRPKWEFSLPLEIVMWGVPLAIIVALSAQLWKSTHQLDPYKPIAAGAPALNVQVVALNWKWLFIYPDLGIASVGQMAFPIDRPVSLTLTSDTVMQSFMISALAGQIYVMPGGTTKLNLNANYVGVFEGENTQFNGAGFQDQKFDALGMSPDAFEAWIANVRASGVDLNKAAYARLAQNSTAEEARAQLGTPAMPKGAIFFKSAPPDLFQSVLARYRGAAPLGPHDQPGGAFYSNAPAGAKGN